MATDEIDRSQCPARQHGTPHAYSRYRCRCPDARDASRPYWRRRSKQLAGIGHYPSRIRRGYDPIAVERALAGDHSIVLTADELTAAIAKCTRWRMSALQIAERLGVAPRTVVRHRRRAANLQGTGEAA